MLVPMSAHFMTGDELGALFHEEVVAPLLAGVPYAAAQVGTGSDVLGWGPALQVFVAPADVAEGLQ